MIKKENRLRKNKEIEKVFKGGNSFYNQDFTVKVLKNDLGLDRLCVVISSKVSKKAVDRNRIKRQMKAVFSVNTKENEGNRSSSFGRDFLIIGKSAVADKNYIEIKKSLGDLLHRAFK